MEGTLIINHGLSGEKYKERRKGTIADLLTPESSTFTNEIAADKSLLFKGRLVKPSYVVMFDKETKFTIWDGNIVAEYNGEHCQVVPMRPYLDKIFNPEARDLVFNLFDSRSLLFRNLLVQKKFKKSLELLKPRK